MVNKNESMHKSGGCVKIILITLVLIIFISSMYIITQDGIAVIWLWFIKAL
jgi:hypothetical protein